MKTASPPLIALLNSGTQFAMADLFTIVLANGTTVRYTSADTDLTVNGQVFISARIKRGTVRVVAGIAVDTLDLTMYATEGDTPGGIPFIDSLNVGVMDGAHVLLERAFMERFGATPAGTVILFAGRVADISFGRTETRLQVKSDMELLNIAMPRNLYQPSCLHTLFDAGCGLSKAAFGVAGVVQAGATATTLSGAGSKPDNWYTLGTLTFTSGANTGASYTIKSYSGGLITLIRPMLHVPAIGDTFTAWPGCNKSVSDANGCAKFANTLRFRGYPFIPAPETAY